MARLYPPVTEEVLPAFCLDLDKNGNKEGALINISFNLNKAVAANEVSGIVMRLRTISTNTYIITENLEANGNTQLGEGHAFDFNLTTGTCTFSITSDYNPTAVEALKIGQYYKAQFAFVDLNGQVGYWSKIATIKCVAKPKVTIANFNASDINIFSNELLGEYVQDTSTGDSSEKAYSYRFRIYDNQDRLVNDTGTLLHNSSSDISSFSSTDLFRSYDSLKEGQIYHVEYIVTTINGLVVSSPRYQIITMELVDPEEDLTLMVSTVHKNNWAPNIPRGGWPEWEPWEEGLIEIYPDLNGNINNNIDEHGQDKAITGNFVILRSSSKDDFTSWQEIRRFRLSHEVPSSKVIYDQTVEQGITYRYALQQYNRQGFYSRKVYSYKRDARTGEVLLDENGEPMLNDIVADFEDMFLYDGKRQLKIRFNPKVHTFKNDLQEQKIDTIGSKHPFIFRNGNVCYKEFPIQGLISFQMDQANFFITDEDYAQMGLSRFEPNTTTYRNYSKIQLQYVEISSNQFPNTAAKYETLYRKVRKKLKPEQEWTSHEDLLSERLIAAEVIPDDSTTPTVDYYEPILDYTTARRLFREEGIKLYKLNTIVGESTGNENRSETFSKTDLTSENIMTERYFKLLVLDWLTDGKPKLFRSPTEGNYIVRLLNVSMNPENTVGRMIHSFQCTAYEIADFNYETLLALGLLKVEDIIQEEFLWTTQDIKNLFETKPDKNDFYTLDLDNKKVSSFSCIGFAPGDQIRIIFADSVIPLYITIGTTGTYLYDDSREIVDIAIKPADDPGDFARAIQITSKGYINEKFDTIAAINLHTQIGDQLVGPITDYFKPTRVRIDDGYENSPNVYLTEDYDGIKLKVTELLHLHAKRREIIPIFATDYTAIGPNSKYMLTPFGNGFIRQKAISNTYDERFWDKYGNLTEEERTRAMTVEDLVEFTINKCNLDTFCLFEVYIPYYEYERYGDGSKEVVNSGEWVSYIQAYRDPTNFGGLRMDNEGLWGIYDPYLYNKQINENSTDNYKGWWKISLEYNNWLNNFDTSRTDGVLPNWRGFINDCVQDDGTIPHSIYYHPWFDLKYEDNNIVNISVANKVEQTMENIKTPISLDIGNGVIMELIYRLEYIDYTIERENKFLKALKANYLAIKAEALDNIQTYQDQVYTKTAGNALKEKYLILLREAEDAENYQSIINLLTENARIIQQDQVTNYLEREQQLVYNTLNQLFALDSELLDLEEGYDISNARIYPPNGSLAKGKNNYDEAWNELYQSEIEPINKYISSTAAQAIVDIQNKYFLHIPNSTIEQYNFEKIIANILNSLNSYVSTITNEINELGPKSYVNQYLKSLKESAQAVFFNDTISSNNPTGITLDFTPTDDKLWAIVGDKTSYNEVWKLFHKGTNDSAIPPLKGTELNSELWDMYFHTAPTDISFSRIEVVNTDSNTNIGLSNLDKYPLPNLENPEDESNILYDELQNSFVYKPIIIKTYRKNINTDNMEEYKTYDCPYGIVGFLYEKINEIHTTLERYNPAEQMHNYMKKYGIAYNQLEAPEEFEFFTKRQYFLGDILINNDDILIKKGLLETAIDKIILARPSINAEGIWELLLREEFIKSLPSADSINAYLAGLTNEEVVFIEASIKDFLKDYVIWYLSKDENSVSKRDLFQQAYACYEYKNLHQDELTSDQIDIIDTTIRQFKALIDNNYSINQYIKDNDVTAENYNDGKHYIYNNSLSKYELISENSEIEFSATTDYYLFIATPYDIFNNSMYEWIQDYDNIYIPDTELDKEELEQVVYAFNQMVNIKNNARSQFIYYRNKYKFISENYEITDNIKDILWEERELYRNAYNDVKEIYDRYNKTFATLDDDVIFEAYIEFLEAYIASLNSTTTNTSAKYRQLLAEAEAMAATIIDESNNPAIQRERITEAWKLFLDKLAEVYQIEVKERFG